MGTWWHADMGHTTLFIISCCRHSVLRKKMVLNLGAVFSMYYHTNFRTPHWVEHEFYDDREYKVVYNIMVFSLRRSIIAIMFVCKSGDEQEDGQIDVCKSRTVCKLVCTHIPPLLIILWERDDIHPTPCQEHTKWICISPSLSILGEVLFLLCTTPIIN
jgi:hypothetical protein